MNASIKLTNSQWADLINRFREKSGWPLSQLATTVHATFTELHRAANGYEAPPQGVDQRLVALFTKWGITPTSTVSST